MSLFLDSWWEHDSTGAADIGTMTRCWRSMVTRDWTISVRIVVGRVPHMTGILDTVAVHPLSLQLRCCMLHLCCSVVVVLCRAVGPVLGAGLLIAHAVVSAGGGSGAGAALLVTQVNILHSHTWTLHSALVSSLLQSIQPVIHTAIRTMSAADSGLDNLMSG